jgi:hypothetical protein
MDQIVAPSRLYDERRSHLHPCRKYQISVSYVAQRWGSQQVRGVTPLALAPQGEQAEDCVCVPSGSRQNAGWGQVVISTTGLVD